MPFWSETTNPSSASLGAIVANALDVALLYRLSYRPCGSY
jgi:hypothetical protein